jgi:putative sugar O-methyltransferase
MLWKFAERHDSEHLLGKIDEPTYGNPFHIFFGGKLISQDLANSVLEYYSIREGFNPTHDRTITIAELGAGYGRTAYVFINALLKCKYVVIDIPPALYIAQSYLTSVFPRKRIFSFRCFANFSDVENEFEHSDIAFLLPHQAEMLAEKSVDLFINISSLHEMRLDQISVYFSLINKLTKGYFYTKQHLTSSNPEDGLILRSKDYPVPQNWKQVYFREAKVQNDFFEAMYAI